MRRSIVRNLISVILVVSLIFVIQVNAEKIACIGNSITSYKGAYPNNIHEDSYPVQLRILMGDEYEIQNFGVSGTTLLKHGDYPIWDELAFSDALAFEPDIVTILLGTNDSKPQNWVYKDEFIPDYTAMVDTFLSLGSNPEIYACLPPPAFSSKYDITDSIIVNDICPMIQQVADDKNLPVIDFYTHFLDKAYLSYDGIHPTEDGLWEYAKVIYNTLTGNTVQSIKEVNLALNKPVYPLNGTGVSDYLVDGDVRTVWDCGEGGSVTIDLGAIESVDMFQILLSAPVNFGYTIEISGDSATWATAAGPSDNPDTTQAAIESIDPTDARWVRFSFDPGEQPLQIVELRVLETAVIHAPAMTYTVNRVTSSYVKYDLTITSSIKGGYIKYISTDSLGGIYAGGMGYRLNDKIVKPEVLLDGQERYYVAEYYNNGYDVSSDVIKVDYSIVTGVKGKALSIPGRFDLGQNYPNPFNPSTMIRYHLETAGKIKIVVYDCLGKEVGILADGFQRAGDHSVQFRSGHLSSGVYFYTLEAGGLKIARKMLLIK